MSWKELKENDFVVLRKMRNIKLLADEDLEDEVVDYIKDRKVNIKSVKDYGRTGLPDEAVAALARKEERFLITKNSRDFLNDHKFPLNKVYGIIVLDGDMKNTVSYVRCVQLMIAWIIPHEWAYKGSKIKVGPSEIQIKGIDYTGKASSDRYKISGNKSYAWVD